MVTWLAAAALLVAGAPASADPKRASLTPEQLRAQVAAPPVDAKQQIQLAIALLELHAGAAARRVARKAIELEPRNAGAHAVLGTILTYDSVGRPYGFDHDRAGAIAALRQAIALDPRSALPHRVLAQLLERDPRGYRFQPGSDLPAAIAEWKAAVALDASATNQLGLLYALLWSDPSAAVTTAHSMPAGGLRDQLLVAAIARTPAGPAEAIRIAGELQPGDGRKKLLDGAGGLLAAMRAYELMHALFVASGKSSDTPADGDPLVNLTRHDQPLDLAHSPTDAVAAAVLLLAEPGAHPDVFIDAPLEAAFRAEGHGQGKLGKIEDLGGHGALLDLVWSSLDLSATGGTTGPWRVRTKPDTSDAVYVVREHGAPRIVGTTFLMAGTARYLLTLRERGKPDDLATAQQLLDWLTADAVAPKQRPSLAPALAALWGAGRPRDWNAIATLAGVVSADPRAAPALQRCVEALDARLPFCAPALELSLNKRSDWQELAAIATALRAKPEASKVQDWLDTMSADAAMHTEQLAEADELLGTVLARSPSFHRALLLSLWVATARNDRDQIAARALRLTNAPDATELDQNRVAWLLAIFGSDLDHAREVALAGIARKDGPGIHNTLAFVEAERGDLAAAVAAVDKTMDLARRQQPADEDWYVLGRVYEQLGLRDDALAAYGKIKDGPLLGVDFLPTLAGLGKERRGKLASTSHH